MKNYHNNKIKLIDCVSDLALATIILGIAMIVLGSTMIIGSVISMANGYSLMGGSSNLLFFAMTHGLVFIADGILLSAFCFLVATTSPLANSFNVLSGFSFFCMILDTVALIMGAALGANTMGIVVSIAGLVISGIIAYKGRSESEILNGTEFPGAYLTEKKGRSTLYGLYLNGFKGETTIVFKTDVLKKYPFPEIEGEKYVPEDYIYDKIDAGYEYIVMPRILTVCELVSQGYTDSVRKLKENNKEAWYLYYEQRARITPMSVLKLKYLGFYRLYARMTGHPLKESKDIPGWQKLLGIPGEVSLTISGKM